MVASVLSSQRAAEVSIYVVRAFVRLRELLSTHKELAHALTELEKRVSGHDGSIRSIVEAIRQLMTGPDPKTRKIGFVKERRAVYRTSRSMEK